MADGLHVFIYDDIVTPDYTYLDSQMSAAKLEKLLEGNEESTIHVHINSYGGFISEGLAMYNLLAQQDATIITYNDGFCCSAAFLPFLAGDIRIASDASVFFPHNGMTTAFGNANELRKEADAIETMTKATIQVFVNRAGMSEAEVQQLFDGEEWMLPADALGYGIATDVRAAPALAGATQSVRKQVLQALQTAAVPLAQEDEEEAPAPDKRFFNFKEKK